MPPISTKPTITSHLNSLNIYEKTTYNVGIPGFMLNFSLYNISTKVFCFKFKIEKNKLLIITSDFLENKLYHYNYKDIQIHCWYKQKSLSTLHYIYILDPLQIFSDEINYVHCQHDRSIYRFYKKL
jgi:hypothetical protein